MLTAYCFIVAQSTDMQFIILLLNINNLEIKRRFRWIDKVVETARRQTKIIGACMHYLTSCIYKKLCMGWAFIHIMLRYTQ